ncbi:MAG: hypothetical protein ACE5I5_16380 [Candidatus Heimdallarchaeota archaeon]
MGNLASFQELVTRYESGENAFDLTLEKWVRIRESLKSASAMLRFREIMGAAAIKVPSVWKTTIIVPYALCRPFAAEARRDHLGNSCGRFRLTALGGRMSSQN